MKIVSLTVDVYIDMWRRPARGVSCRQWGRLHCGWMTGQLGPAQPGSSAAWVGALSLVSLDFAQVGQYRCVLAVL
jgi:hypothetical protein